MSLRFLERAYWTVGAYDDMVAIFEAPDEEALSAHLLEVGSLFGQHANHHAPSLRRARDVGGTRRIPHMDYLWRCLVSRTSENPIKAKFAEFYFHALR